MYVKYSDLADGEENVKLLRKSPHFVAIVCVLTLYNVSDMSIGVTVEVLSM